MDVNDPPPSAGGSRLRAARPGFLELADVSKSYGGVRALERVDFSCARGSIHAVLGENGAGKSTLIKIIAGVVRPDSGSMRLEGSEITLDGPASAARVGIVPVFQELSLVPDLSVADNISLADPPRRFGLIDGRTQRRRAKALLDRLGSADLDTRELVKNLPLSRRQLVEIAKALGKAPRLLILDEATSALTAADVEKVYGLLAELKAEDTAILFISHRMHEIAALADRCSVFRNGRHVETFDAGTRSGRDVVQLMIGRDITQVYPPKPATRAARKPALEVEGLTWGDRLAGIDLTIGAGEIVGLGGLDGQGQRDLLLALFGVLAGVDAKVRVDGCPVRIGSPSAANRAGIEMALIPEDRKTEGLLLPMSIADNLTLAALSRLTTGGVVDPAREAAAIARAVDGLRIKLGGRDDAVGTLSGGNQQKVVLGKWLMTEPRIVLLNDPTRGIDVGTKQEIYELLRRLADHGAAVLFYSTDYDELIGCCDRVLILYGGRVVRTLEGDAITETAIVESSLNLPVTLGAAA